MVALLLTVGIARYNKSSVIPDNPRGRKAMFFRGLVGAPLFSLFVFSSMVLPTQIFTVLINMNIAYSVILGPCLTNEWPTIKSGLMVLLSIFGVIMITDPSLIGIGTGEELEDYPKIALLTVTMCAFGTVGISTVLSKFSKCTLFITRI
jgi:drug/metabolite transporter (DMT)-like permease